MKAKDYLNNLIKDVGPAADELKEEGITLYFPNKTETWLVNGDELEIVEVVEDKNVVFVSTRGEVIYDYLMDEEVPENVIERYKVQPIPF